MATEIPIQIVEASGKWGSTNMGIEDFGLVLTSQQLQGQRSNLHRSGSAPPSIEGSVASIENLIFSQNHKGISESEEQFQANPSYFEYNGAVVNLNPRLPPPLISRRSLWLDHGNLSTHREELNDDRSPKQDDFPRAHSPASNKSHLFIQEPKEKAGIHDDSNPTTTNISGSSSIHSIQGNMVIKPPTNSCLNSLPMSGVADVSAIRNGVVSLNISSFPKLENEIHEINWQQRNSYPIHVTPPQTYVGLNQFLQNPTNFLSEIPSHYARDQGYMTSETQIYQNMMPAGYFPQQYTTGRLAVNLPPISPYVSGYLPSNLFPTPFENIVPSFSGQSQTSGVNLQHLNTLYGHFGLPFSGEEYILQSFGGMGHIDLNSRYFGSPTNMDFLQFPSLPFTNLLMLDPGRRNERMYDGWKGHGGNYSIIDQKMCSLLEELRSGKGRRLELSDIYGHIVEFSVDQYGSRFIQQKLEVCSNEEKESVFKEVFAHAWKLMTDAFGNYVIQKFFEYGNTEQKRELVKQIEGHILPLSLQMYGCRVVQRALGTFELEQKIKIVNELDGHFIKCVCDQNGNHVMQKCIECLPPENIKRVISSFRGQVAALSKHSYGCRVMQRVLERSTDALHIQFIVDEILDSAFDLVQDQYGNYVTQYVLKRGKPEERSQIIHKLAGHVVKLSQHKFASNVIEKCLEYGDEAARKIIIEEIIGYADCDDNLLVMLKDQFANYVVQKVLQTCSGYQREVLLSRIKIHLSSLKKYTYGKHIAACFEQLYGKEIDASSCSR
ncbi:hypothetical protein R6Q59_023463 [Mikania micrantha]